MKSNQIIAFRTVLFNFLLVAIIGLSLRWITLSPVLGVNYRHLVHTHSHMAFLGWVFGALFVAITTYYLPDSKGTFYRKVFWGLQLAVFGMLFTFPFQGYAVGSIIFSTLHTALAYFFIVRFWTNSKLVSNDPGLKYIRTGLVFFVLSTIGPFILGYVSSKGLQGSDLYDLSLYFYLHFQYNGWFSFAVYGLFISWLYQAGLADPKFTEKHFFWLMTITLIPQYSLSTLWADPPSWVYVVGVLSSLVQAIAVILFFRSLLSITGWTIKMVWWTKLLWGVSAFSFIMKIVLQLISSFPFGVELVLSNHHLIIAYLHLVFLGFISSFILGWFIQNGWLRSDLRLVQLGVVLFLLGFISTELILLLPFYSTIGPDSFLLLISAIPLATGILLLFVGGLRNYAKDSTTFSSSIEAGE